MLVEDPVETQEWLEALASVVDSEGVERARVLMAQLWQRAQQYGCAPTATLNTPYCNTISAVEDPELDPEELAVAARLRSWIRWNAMVMVVRAQQDGADLGGHIGTFASAAVLYDIGFNHFWRAPNATQLGDMIYFQGHISPGIYARSFLEGRLTEKHLENFRREVDGNGLSSYPHPWLMPDYWQFPTVSMGLGPLQAIYQARFMKYLEARGFLSPSDRKVWCFCGDGEMDEPESIGALTVAAREKLNNLVFVVNCNLQRLDGPVRGNGKIIQELEALFAGAGWDVIKVVWGDKWDALLEKDTSGKLLQRMEEVLDGEYQSYKALGGAYVREHFFGKYPELAALVADMSDEEIYKLNRGGHDPVKVYAAYERASRATRPTVILAKTVKGYGLGKAGEARNVAHNTKKLAYEDLKAFRDRFHLPIPDDQLESLPFYKPAADTPEMKYLKASRERLGGFLPQRAKQAPIQLKMPSLESFESVLQASEDRTYSSTMAFVRILNLLTKDPEIGKRIVPIVPDEARTFGMEGLFRQLGIYAVEGQKYKPVDSQELMFYKEAKDGQILQEGINESGSFCSWLAAATSYSQHQCPMIPFYIYYSMFGHQRIGDLAWAAGDLRAKGFLLGATAGRTTLNGEGLQHQDGHSHLMAATIPNCRSYDPTFGYEVAVIIQHGLQEMYGDNKDVHYYITLMNENYAHPGFVKGQEQGIIRGMYALKQHTAGPLKVQLLGSGTILVEVLKAAEQLAEHYQISSNVFSATSFSELRREALDCARWNLYHPDQAPRESYVTSLLKAENGPVVAATDYMRLVPDQIRPFIQAPYHVLGTDGFGRSDTRAKLREHFEVDAAHIVYQALYALVQEGALPLTVLADAQQRYHLTLDKPNPWEK